MHIHEQPNKARAFKLLSQSGLPSSDLAENSLETFLGCGEEDNPSGIIGLEIHDSYGLLRSLAVAPEVRNLGLGKELVSKIELLAKSKRLESIYLLTNTAEQFFTRLGYCRVERATVPEPIKRTTEFSSLCPDSATVMKKVLS
jgi:amino-acid N-acetyltransferase